MSLKSQLITLKKAPLQVNKSLELGKYKSSTGLFDNVFPESYAAQEAISRAKQVDVLKRKL